ncbi:DUF5309 domain-containing protein [Anaerofustis stercorihominis]|uniref:DUF5309 domain-containing protein n=1 Tax=Anaerofustis stercorihominis TaxID=214853 RepID=UPI00214CB308|nr:DUF5309 domain-containing protein [Anaerofustis stercorihominis]MCR2033710.1 DUF5309 domain-containing protein [Anaerofustis stercorihominis]
MANANYTQSFDALNYSGFLFNKGNTSTPFTSMISGKQKTTNSVEFPTGVEFTTATGSQPAISEEASLIAPEGSTVTRTQKTNVTQMFQETYGVSYGKQSNMGTLAGLNISGQVANPIDEKIFQKQAKLTKMAQDIEYTFINGTYNKATKNTEINKTRGIVSAIESVNNNIAGKELTFWDVCDTVTAIKGQNAPTDNLVLGVDGVTLMQINADAVKNNLTIVPSERTINGIAIMQYITPAGMIYIRELKYLPVGTAIIFNPNAISPVHQMTPGKGNFFEEQLAKTGAGERYQLFGQIGLDHGPEWYHGKITGIATTYTKPEINTVKIVSDAQPASDTPTE